ncbi:hypothetical protein DFH29DRAFT_881761 [Suillus ampliporus]|nr:hypothetical protein DFH29DRAFT_881761 [Suillus ampliporus]
MRMQGKGGGICSTLMTLRAIPFDTLPQPGQQDRRPFNQLTGCLEDPLRDPRRLRKISQCPIALLDPYIFSKTAFYMAYLIHRRNSLHGNSRWVIELTSIKNLDCVKRLALYDNVLDHGSFDTSLVVNHTPSRTSDSLLHHFLVMASACTKTCSAKNVGQSRCHPLYETSSTTPSGPASESVRESTPPPPAPEPGVEEPTTMVPEPISPPPDPEPTPVEVNGVHHEPEVEPEPAPKPSIPEAESGPASPAPVTPPPTCISRSGYPATHLHLSH